MIITKICRQSKAALFNRFQHLSKPHEKIFWVLHWWGLNSRNQNRLVVSERRRERVYKRIAEANVTCFGKGGTTECARDDFLPLKIVANDMQSTTIWQGKKDSNPQQRFWRPTCYHYTIPLCNKRIITELHRNVNHKFLFVTRLWIVILNAKGNEFPRTGITSLPHLFFIPQTAMNRNRNGVKTWREIIGIWVLRIERRARRGTAAGITRLKSPRGLACIPRRSTTNCNDAISEKWTRNNARFTAQNRRKQWFGKISNAEASAARQTKNGAPLSSNAHFF